MSSSAKEEYDMCNQKVRYDIEIRNNVASLKEVRVFDDKTLEKYQKCRASVFNKEKRLQHI